MSAESDLTQLLEGADFRLLVEQNADGILVVDDQGVIVFANPAAFRTFGRKADALLGTSIGVPLVVGETTEIAILRPGGSQIDAEMRVAGTSWQGRPALLATLRDISARKEMETRLRDVQKLESIGTLTAGIAHDFNNLLTIILGNLATVQRETGAAGANPKLTRAVEHAIEGAQRATSLTQRLLAFVRRQPLEPKTLEVNKLVDGMSDLLRRTLGEKIQIRAVLSERPLHTFIDPTQLEAAILNLAVNARDAMPEGGCLIIETRDAVWQDPQQGGASEDCIEIRVSDSGVGMTKEVIARAFEPFFTTKDVGKGTGLGLPQVYGFVKQSGGSVDIESAPGAGTTVTLRLPRLPPPSAESEPAQDFARRGATVLVVDDEDAVRRYAVEALTEQGYCVHEARDAASALRLIDERPEIELLFTDIGLPGGMNGRQLAAAGRLRRPGLRALMTTAYAGALLRDGRLDPNLQLLPKPFTREELGVKVRTALARVEKPLRILIIEDEALVRMTMAEALVDSGCHVEEAATASEAISKFRDQPDGIDAAIIDVGLPDGRGDRLVEDFRAQRPDLPILLSTGYADMREQAALAHDPRIRILEKPFDAQRLLLTLYELEIGRGA
ncbi:MAG TPA: response regulator [Alphaproteobacteria bacterium]|nr:response regulator [Alphaproteobacteria bacterium]